jgi:hypothetical protein
MNDARRFLFPFFLFFNVLVQPMWYIPSLSTALNSGSNASLSFASRGGAGVGGGLFVTGGLPWV